MKRAIAAVAAVLMLTACSKVTKENYEKLKVGMSYEQVEKILGKPTSCDDAMFARACIWGDEKRNISVTFLGKQVILHAATGIR